MPARQRVVHSWRELGGALAQWAFPSRKAVRHFEEIFGHFHSVPFAVSFSSARASLYFLLQALKLPPGSEVLLSGLNYPGIPDVVRLSGCRPVFVDIEATTLNLSLADLKKKWTPKSTVLLLTHAMGIPCEMDKLLQFAQQKKLIVLEDCAHALGSTYKGRPLGTFGTASFFSFRPGKALDSCGGSLVLTTEAALHRSLREAQAFFQPAPRWWLLKRLMFSFLSAFFSTPLGFALCVRPWLLLSALSGKDVLAGLTKDPIRPLRRAPADFFYFYHPLQARLALEGLGRLPQEVEARQRCATLYRQLLARWSLLPASPSSGSQPFYLHWTLYLQEKTRISRRLFLHGIDHSQDYLAHCPALPLFRPFASPTPALDSLFPHLLYLPCHRGVRQRTMKTIRKVLGARQV